MFEFRLRILEVRERETDPFSYLGLVEGFPAVLAHASTLDACEADLVGALGEYLDRLRRPDETRVDLDEFPTIREVRLRIARPFC